MMRKAILILANSLFALLLSQGTLAQNTVPADLPAGVRVVLDGHKLPPGSYSFVVQEAGAAEPVLAIDSDRPMNPASTIKTLTTLSALETLGPAYTWQTELYALGPVVDGVLQGDLLLKGSGDPFLVEEQLRSMLKSLQRIGIRHVTGNLVLDGSFFDPSVSAADDIDNQAGRSYNTDPNAVLANFQSVTFYFYPHGNGRDVLVIADPRLPNLSIDNRLRQRAGACGGYQRGISFDTNPDKPGEVIFSGSFPSGCSRYQMTREVLDAPAYTFGLFQGLWRELGGELDGSLVLGQAPEDMKPVLIWTSSPLADIVRSINKFSNNLMSRHLLLTLGAEASGAPATVEKGVAAVNQYLAGVGVDTSPLRMMNGSGLARETRVTTALMTDVLQQGWRSRFMPEFLASLPLNGMDGTMRNRLRGSMAGSMHIKTGTLDEVSAVAGYVRTPGGRTFTVSGILNHELADRGPGVELMNALLAWVYTL